MSTRIRKSLVIDGKTLVTEEAWNAAQKMDLQAVLTATKS